MTRACIAVALQKPRKTQEAMSNKPLSLLHPATPPPAGAEMAFFSFKVQARVEL
jgi:hypothetical protein